MGKILISSKLNFFSSVWALKPPVVNSQEYHKFECLIKFDCFWLNMDFFKLKNGKLFLGLLRNKRVWKWLDRRVLKESKEESFASRIGQIVNLTSEALKASDS